MHWAIQLIWKSYRYCILRIITYQKMVSILSYLIEIYIFIWVNICEQAVSWSTSFLPEKKKHFASLFLKAFNIKGFVTWSVNVVHKVPLTLASKHLCGTSFPRHQDSWVCLHKGQTLSERLQNKEPFFLFCLTNTLTCICKASFENTIFINY